MIDIIKNSELDDAGTFTEPFPDDMPVYDFRKMMAYLRESGRDSSELSQEEIDRFRVEKK